MRGSLHISINDQSIVASITTIKPFITCARDASSLHLKTIKAMAAASVRALIILAMLACALVMRSADAAAAVLDKPIAVPVGAQHCDPSNKTCHPGDPQAPENQEEEVTSVNVPGASFGDEGEDADELPSFDQELIVLGH